MYVFEFKTHRGHAWTVVLPCIYMYINILCMFILIIPTTASLAVNVDRRLKQTKSWEDTLSELKCELLFFTVIFLIFYVSIKLNICLPTID